MKKNARLAFNALKKIGAPVLDPDRGWGGYFAISAEMNDDKVWADMYDAPPEWDFGINPEISEILDNNDLYAEWVNGGVLAVYEA